MHQPLAALTPLLLFPLENRTSTHPPSTPVRPSRPSRPPSPPPSLSAASCLSRIRAPVKYSGRHPRRLRHSRNSVPVSCVCGWFSSSSSNAHDLCYPLRSRRRSSSRCFRLSRFLLPFPPSPISLLASSSSSLFSYSLLRKRLVSSSSRFPSLPVLHPVHPPIAAAANAAPLSEFARSLRRLTLCLSYSDQFVSPVRSQSVVRARILSNILAHADGHPSCVFLSPIISSMRPFFIPLSIPRSRPSISASHRSSSVSSLSRTCAENPPCSPSKPLPPRETSFHQLLR